MTVILKPVLLCVAGIIIITIVRKASPEFTPPLSIICAIVLIIYTVPYLKTVYGIFLSFKNKTSGVSEFVSLSLKIIGISLLCEFASQLCIDNNEKFIADKIDFVGKALILSMISPTILSFMEGIFDKLNLL